MTITGLTGIEQSKNDATYDSSLSMSDQSFTDEAEGSADSSQLGLDVKRLREPIIKDLRGEGVTFLDDVSKNPRFAPSSLMVSAIMIIFLVMIGFSGVKVPVVAKTMLAQWGYAVPSPSMVYYFSTPFVLFMSGVLGPLLTLLTLTAYVAIGMFGLPIFSGGGGMAYFQAPSFGYIVGWIVGGFIAAILLRKAFKANSNVRRSIRMAWAGIAGVLIVHGLGVLYLSGMFLLQSISLDAYVHYLVQNTLYPLPLDLMASVVFMTMVRYCRLVMWGALY